MARLDAVVLFVFTVDCLWADKLDCCAKTNCCAEDKSCQSCKERATAPTQRSAKRNSETEK